MSLQCQVRAKVAVVDGAIGELRVEVEFSKRADLSNPPVGRLKAIFIRVTADKDDALGLKLDLASLRVEDAAGKQIPAGRDYAFQWCPGVLERLIQVLHQFRVGGIG